MDAGAVAGSAALGVVGCFTANNPISVRLCKSGVGLVAVSGGRVVESIIERQNNISERNEVLKELEPLEAERMRRLRTLYLNGEYMLTLDGEIEELEGQEAGVQAELEISRTNLSNAQQELNNFKRNNSIGFMRQLNHFMAGSFENFTAWLVVLQLGFGRRSTTKSYIPMILPTSIRKPS